MIKSSMVFRGRPYVKIQGSWRLLCSVAAAIDRRKELKKVG